MRSSKSRSRSKSNRNRSMGNIVNRVFDSSGPEGKVRGTPQQIIDKYNQLARDAQLSNDRIAAENFQQHAEHYTRLLSEAQREQEARREAQERERAERQQQNQNQNRDRGQQDGDQPPAAAVDPGQAPQPDTMDPVASGGDGDSGLVETPETQSEPQPRQRRRRNNQQAKPAADAEESAPPAEAAE